MVGIFINGEEYVKVDKGSKDSSRIKIVILQRGWVMVGKFSRDGNDCVLRDSSVIRNWGTQKGLGEIAKKGPLEKTILDANYYDVEFDYLTVVAALCVNEEKWKSVL